MATEPIRSTHSDLNGDSGLLKAVVCGTFRRDADTLWADYAELSSLGCEILSPRDLEFVDERDGFVFAAHEQGRLPEAIEDDHLDALQRADLVWLHAPEGYVGLSASMELGFAHALGIPVFARALGDVGLRTTTQLVSSPAEALAFIRSADVKAPTRALPSLQAYYARIAKRRGYDTESARDCVLLLVEEIGELARATRVKAGLARNGSAPAPELAHELADVQLYLVHLANITGIDLGAAVAEKERINASRAEDEPLPEAA